MADDLNISFFGKTPSHADFVRFNTASETFRSVDRWIQAGLLAAQAKNAADLDASYDAAGVSSFLFWSDDRSSAFVGSIRPSRDSSGRRFPFFVAAELEEAALSSAPLAQLPFRFMNFLEESATLVDDVVEGRLSVAELSTRLEVDPSVHSGEELVRDHKEVLQDMGFKEFCERLWGSFDDVRKYALFKNIFDLLLPLKGHCPPPLGLGIVFPLADDTSLAGIGVSFWLESCQRITGCPEIHPMMIWNRNRGPGGTPPMLYVNMVRTPPSAFMRMLHVPTESDDIFVLEELGAHSAAEVALSIPALYGSLIETEGLSLLDFAQRLG